MNNEKISGNLYDHPIPSTRIGSIFNAHSYPTKINTTAVVACIMAHTQPGDTVFDGFSGSGATGLAAALCENPDPELRQSVETLLGEVRWGARNCVLYDLSELATFISRVLLNPPDPKPFLRTAAEVLNGLNAEWGWMYEAQNEALFPGTIRYTLWTDHPICPHCETASTFWDLAIRLSPPTMASVGTCPNCKQTFDLPSAKRLMEDYWDDLLEQSCRRRIRTPVYVYGKDGALLWKRPVNREDLKLLGRIDETTVPPSVPMVPMLGQSAERWGELYRSGYHAGITHLHHFYTRRNLIALAAAWQMTQAYDGNLREALRFWISSYNATHSTLMTRVVRKQNAKDFILTGAQPAALYISSLPVEKNVFAGLRTKLKPISQAFRRMQNRKSQVSVHCASSLNVHLPDASVDYIFTDPPFGDNIQYSEVNFISEAWLGRTTRTQDEAIISKHQGKSVQAYQALLTGSFKEAYRILKPGRYMTVAFHSAKAEVWGALQHAWTDAGFQLVRTSILDKKQTSFKQTTTQGAVKGDPLILLRKPPCAELTDERSQSHQAIVREPWEVMTERLSDLDDISETSMERTKQRLYSYLITYYLEQGQPIPLDAKTFFAELDRRFHTRGDRYYLKP